MLGNEQLITCRLQAGGHLVQVRSAADQTITVGETLHLDPDPSGWRFFEADGEAINRPEPNAEEEGPQLPVLP